MSTNQKEKTTFTKSILSIVVLLYFLGAMLGGVLVVVAAIIDVGMGLGIDSSMFIAYAAYLGGPTATAICFYAWKSKAENILKIQNANTIQQTEQQATLSSTLASMGGNI